MANSYSAGTGTLTLNAVTPVIVALFSIFNLDKDYPGDRKAYISQSFECDKRWNSLKEYLVDLARNIGLNVTQESTFLAVISALAVHFNVPENNEFISSILSYTEDDFDADVSFDELFSIAKLFDDGHGLTNIEFETSYHCDKPRLGACGGTGEYHGKHFSSIVHSGDIALAGAIDEALTKSDVKKAAWLVSKEIYLMLQYGFSNAPLLPSFMKSVAECLNERADFIK